MKIWKLLIELVVQPGDVPSGATKGFMNITTWGSTAQEVRDKVSRYLESFNWQVVAVEECAPVQDDFDYGETLLGMIERTQKNREAIILGSFHAYKGE